jgi:dihydroxyacetone kinase
MDILGAIEQTLGEIFFDDPPPTPPPPKMAKKLINDPSRVVPDAIDGLLMTDSRLRRVGDLNIIVRHDIEVFRRSAVTIISGGGSGHEPAHAGYIGEG